jgi:hypothetical protein
MAEFTAPAAAIPAVDAAAAAAAADQPIPGSYSAQIWDYYHPRNRWDGQVWSPGTYPCKSFPQLTSKPDLGIAISGGGLRAASLGLGWLRALNRHGLVTNARYLSVNSGGSWVAEPLLWWAVLNGKSNASMTPEEVDTAYRQALDDASASHIPHALTQNFIGAVLSNVVHNTFSWGTKKNVWSDAVENFFKAALGPAYHALNMNYLDVGDESPESSRLPFLIVNGSMIAVEGHDGRRGSVHAAPFEFTPTYCGIPIDPNVLHPGAFQNSGGFVHRSVFDIDYSNKDKAVTKTDADTTKVKHYNVIEIDRTQTPNPFKLAEISSVSSSAVVEGYYEHFIYSWKGQGHKVLDYNFPVERQYWAYNEKAGHGDNLVGGNVKFADGASTDNTGILALLRRGVKNVVCFNAMENDIARGRHESEHAHKQRLLNWNYDYMALFGAVTSAPSWIPEWETYNNQRKVFDPAKWDELFAAMSEKRTNGDPLVHTLYDLPVAANPLCGVEAYEVNITFVWNGITSKYPDVDWHRLHQISLTHAFDHVNNVVGGLAGAYPVTYDFPIVSTSVLHYSPELVAQLASIADWSVEAGNVVGQLRI